MHLYGDDMWLFGKERKNAHSRTTHEFAGAVPGDIAAKLREEPPKHFEPRAGQIHFLLIQLRDDSLESVPQLLMRVFDIVQGRQCIVDAVMSSYVSVSVRSSETDAAVTCRSLVSDLLRELPESVKVVHGKRDCLQGVVGSGPVLRPGFFLQGFAKIVSEVGRLSFGESVEVR